VTGLDIRDVELLSYVNVCLTLNHVGIFHSYVSENKLHLHSNTEYFTAL
jgi:hypothetical protein